MRVLLFTGKGGVGKTSVAAATAVRAARSGLRTLVMSTDPAHSLGDVLDTPVGSEPTPVAERLEAEQIDAQQRLEDSWREVRSYLVSLLRTGGVGQLEAEELSVVPGLEELFSLADLQRHVVDGRWDLLVVDCAPTAETLRLLSLPDALGWYLQRVLPLERSAVAALVRPLLGPVLERAGGVPLPEDAVLAAGARLYRRLADVRRILVDGSTTSIRLVLTPERVVLAETRRTYTYLCLFGYGIDAVMLNRLLPADVADARFAGWQRRQADLLAEIRRSFDGLPVLTAPLLADEPVGVARLAALGETLYDRAEPDAVLAAGEPLRFREAPDGYELSLALPFAATGAIDLRRRGDELFVRVGPYKRALTLPVALAGYDVARAAVEQGRLSVQFQPRPPARPAVGS